MSDGNAVTNIFTDAAANATQGLLNRLQGGKAITLAHFDNMPTQDFIGKMVDYRKQPQKITIDRTKQRAVRAPKLIDSIGNDRSLMQLFYALLLALRGKQTMLTHDPINTIPGYFNASPTQTGMNLLYPFGYKRRRRHDRHNGRQQLLVIQLNLGAGLLALVPLCFLLPLPEIIVIRRFGYTQHQAEQINRKQSAGRVRLFFTEAIYGFRLAAIARAFFKISFSNASLAISFWA